MKTKPIHRHPAKPSPAPNRAANTMPLKVKNEDRCPYSRKCGGCQLQNLPYERQLQFKQGRVLRFIGRFCRVKPIIGMEHPFHYRNKVQSAFGIARNGKIINGVYQSNSHRIVPVENCMTEDQTAGKIIADIRRLLPKFHITAYNEHTQRGFLRHVLVKRGFSTGEIMVVLVAATPVMPSKNEFVRALLKLHPDITTVVLNINAAFTSMVLGEQETVLYGPGYIEDILCGKRFRISARSFYQINPVQTEILYSKAIELARLSGSETVIDAYCGIGTIGIIASDKAKEVIGVELNKDAVEDARVNARMNNVENIRFYAADAGQFMREMAKNSAHADVVLMDPPRAGSDKAFLSSVCVLNPNKIVYISCNPETQGRDLAFLCSHGYKATTAQPVDMFPHTSHIETVVLLSKLNAKQHIEVELNLDELDLTAAESKATYEEIKEYVLEKHGLKVSSLYISQVKRKCGLDVGKNYNLSKKEDAKVPQCPPEKEAAIMEALKHFQMI